MVEGVELRDDESSDEEEENTDGKYEKKFHFTFFSFYNKGNSKEILKCYL